MAYRIILRQDTAENWTTNNPILLSGEAGYETVTGRLKMGDGTTRWADLDYYKPSVFVDVPLTADATGITGDMAFDTGSTGSTGYFYVAVGTDTWKRASLLTF